MLKSTIFFVTAFAVTTTAVADTVVHEGITYTYRVKPAVNGRVITGQDSHGRKFVLRVRKSTVDGIVDGSPVSFSTRDVIRLKPTVVSTEVAAR
jgi:hypothetical protein